MVSALLFSDVLCRFWRMAPWGLPGLWRPSLAGLHLTHGDVLPVMRQPIKHISGILTRSAVNLQLPRPLNCAGPLRVRLRDLPD